MDVRSKGNYPPPKLCHKKNQNWVSTAQRAKNYIKNQLRKKVLRDPFVIPSPCPSKPQTYLNDGAKLMWKLSQCNCLLLDKAR